MAATGFLSPQCQFIDDNGDPLAGGFLYSYTAGTSTPQDTFLDADLAPGHENTNPVELDSAGRAVIYLSPTPAYKFILKDANLVTIWTQDDVSPAMVAT
jgi:hypothetical protein